MKSPPTSSRRRPIDGKIAGEGDRKHAGEIHPPPISLRWDSLRGAQSSKGRGRGLRYWVPVVARRKGTSARPLRIVNTYPRRRRGRKLLEDAVREALGGRSGSWKARLAAVGACRVEIDGPDRTRWVVFIPNPEGQSLRALTAHLRDACTRPRSPGRRSGVRVATVVLVGEP
jgi:hypothetical protein